MDLVASRRQDLTLEANRPLYERVPTRDENGKLLADFMMLIPGLRDRPQHQFADTLARMQWVLEQFSEVVFADLNIKLNLLWVSVRSRPGVIVDVAATLKYHIPEALLVAERRQP